MQLLEDDRLFPVDSYGRDLAHELFASIRDLPIFSPHGHSNPAWFAKDEPFDSPAALFVTADHYVFRMLYSQGIALEDLGISPLDSSEVEANPREIWRRLAVNYHLFRGTPSRLWIDH